MADVYDEIGIMDEKEANAREKQDELKKNVKRKRSTSEGTTTSTAATTYEALNHEIKVKKIKFEKRSKDVSMLDALDRVKNAFSKPKKFLKALQIFQKLLKKNLEKGSYISNVFQILEIIMNQANMPKVTADPFDKEYQAIFTYLSKFIQSQESSIAASTTTTTTTFTSAQQARLRTWILHAIDINQLREDDTYAFRKASKKVLVAMRGLPSIIKEKNEHDAVPEAADAPGVKNDVKEGDEEQHHRYHLMYCEEIILTLLTALDIAKLQRWRAWSKSSLDEMFQVAREEIRPSITNDKLKATLDAWINEYNSKAVYKKIKMNVHWLNSSEGSVHPLRTMK